MAQRGTQSQTTSATNRSAIRAPETKTAARRASADGNALLLGLQDGVGNRATAGLLRRVGVLQPSLRIGAADDRYEREADRIADRVMQGRSGAEVAAASPAPAGQPAMQRMCSDCEEELRREPLPALGTISEVRAQRACAECEEELEGETLRRDANGGSSSPAGAALESRVASLRGRGAPLSPAQRGFFEPRFGHDLGDVRLHTGPAAAEAAMMARARAFTVGHDVAFGAGEFHPETRSGRRLLAHELTHVVQQTPLVARRKPLIQRQQAPQPGPEAPQPLQEEQPAPAGPESEEAAAEQTPAPGLLVEDDAATLGPGQMTRSAFLAETRAAVCAAADAALAGTEFTAQGCPYVELVLRFYERQSAGRIESDLVGYLPDAAGAASASAYIPLIVNRVRQSVETFVATGEITGIPEGVPSSLLSLVQTASSTGGVLFKARDGGPRGSPDPRAVQAELGRGRPLAGAVRSRMQSAFGRSFSGVRVHAGATASRLSERFNARAFTVGQHVAFGAGEYRPGTMMGDALVAHELAHVAQQASGPASMAPMEIGSSATGALERDADRSSVAAVSSLWGGAARGLAGFARNAVPRLRSGLSIQRCKKETCSEGTKTISVDLVKLDGSTRSPATDLAEANKIYKKCCVQFTVGQQPPAVSNAETKKWLKGDTTLSWDNTSGVTDEEMMMFDEATKNYSLSSRMRFFFVAAVSPSTALGYSIPPYRAVGGQASYVNHSVVTNSGHSDTMAHELGHILLDSGDHSGIDNPSDTHNLMFAPGRTGSDLDASQCKIVYNNA